MTFLDVLDRSVHLFGATIRPIGWMTLIMIIPITFLMEWAVQLYLDLLQYILIFTDNPANTDGYASILIYYLVVILVVALITGLILNIINIAAVRVTDQKMKQEPLDWKAAMKEGIGRKYLRVLGVGVVITGIALGIYLLFLVIIILLAMIHWGLVVIPVLGVIFVELYVVTRLSFILQYIIIENQGIIESLKSSFKLVRGKVARTFLLYLVFSFMVSFAVNIITTPLLVVVLFGFIMELVPMVVDETIQTAFNPVTFAHLLDHIGYGLGLVFALSAIANVITQSIYSTVMYVDLSCRKNGEAIGSPIQDASSESEELQSDSRPNYPPGYNNNNN
jgi:hypothetical protein